MSELDQARQAAAQLAELQKAAADLPRLEAEAAQQAERQAIAQRGQQAAEDLKPLCREYRLRFNEYRLIVKELGKSFADIVEEGKDFDRRAARIRELARDVAASRISLGQTHPALKGWANDHNGQRLQLQAETSQVLQDFDCELGLIKPARDETEEAKAVINLLKRFCDIRTEAPTNGQGPFAGKVMVVDHWGETHWE